MRPRLAASVALRIASGTSRALPWPKPTRPFSSPTTTSAAKPKRRPPFTTLATRLMWTSLSVNSLSRSSRSRRSRGSRAITSFQSVLACPASEAQPALARSIRQRLDPAVVEIAAAVEHHLLDAFRHRPFGQQLADRLGGGDVGAGLEASPHVLLDRGGRGHGLALGIVDHLRVDVLRRAEHREPRPPAGGGAHVAPHFRGPPQRPISDCRHAGLPSLLLAFLAEDELARVFHALALVGLGLAEGADLGGDVADLLAVDAADHDLGRPRRRDRDALRDRVDDVVAVAELNLQVLALHRGPVADAGDLQPPLESLGHALHHIGQQRPVGAPHGAGTLAVAARVDLDLALVHLGLDVVVQHQRKRAFRALHLDDLAFHAGADASRNGNRFFSD